MRVVPCWIVLACLAGCAPTPSGGPACEVGGGDDEFVALEDGDAVTIYAGPQGGFHVNTSARCTGLNPDAWVVRATATYPDGEFLGGGAAWSGAPSDEGGAFVAVGLRNLVDDPASVRDQEILLRIDVEDSQGLSATDELAVLAE